jgi:FkbM family methyltransferase
MPDALGPHTAEIAGFRVGVADRQPTFWAKVARGEWEPHTLAAIRAHAGPGTAFLDVGAWIGATALLAAACGARVLALEPDPEARAQLVANLSANPDLAGRVEVIDRALAGTPGPVRLGARRKPGDSMSSVLLADSAQGWTVETVTVAELAGRLRPGLPLLAKVDVEGAEYGFGAALAGLGAGRPFRLLLSLHPGLYAEARGEEELRAATRRLVGGLAGLRAARVVADAWVPADFAILEADPRAATDWLLEGPQ